LGKPQNDKATVRGYIFFLIDPIQVSDDIPRLQFPVFPGQPTGAYMGIFGVQIIFGGRLWGNDIVFVLGQALKIFNKELAKKSDTVQYEPYIFSILAQAVKA